MRIAVVGSGVSGIAAAKTLGRFGHSVTVFERGDAPGGVWAATYPGVTLQSTRHEYRYSDFDWPFEPAINPTAEQVRAYVRAAVAHFGIDLRLSHEVVGMTETDTGWMLSIATPEGQRDEAFDYAIIATGHHTKDRAELQLANRDSFKGEVLLPHEVGNYDRFTDRRVAVIGLGKTAVDIATFASKRARIVDNIFRMPRWLIPTWLLGQPMTRRMAPRLSAMLHKSWVHSDVENFIQRWFGWMLPAYWRVIGELMKISSGFNRPGRNAAARARLKLLDPPGSVTDQFRGSMAPPGYYPAVAEGRIIPHRGEIVGFTAEGVSLGDGTVVPSDIVVLAVGNATPKFPMLPAKYRAIMECESDGVQLYRHVIHPRIPRLAFIGFNHCIFHIVASEIAATWLGATIGGDLIVPSCEEMEAVAARVRDWKRAYSVFDTVRSYTVANHFHQYFDVMLADLGVNRTRKRPRILDIFLAYEAKDYAGLIDEFRAARLRHGQPLHVQPLDS